MPFVAPVSPSTGEFVLLLDADPLTNDLRFFEEWNGTYFTSVTLASLGLHVQLGHPAGESCAAPEKAPDFTVIDIYGIHPVNASFCGCATADSPSVQLMRHRWFPATLKRPNSATTFNLLEFFQLLSFESKASSYEMYNTIARRTDNTGMDNNVVSKLSRIAL
jgi:hypothetical protein